MTTLKTSDFKNLVLGPTRTCSECEKPELEITEDQNTFECNHCGSVWKRLKPAIREDGKMIDIPKKLKKLLKDGRI